MTVRTVLAPLLRGATYRRGVYLLLGGVLVLPYALLAAVFVRMWTTPGSPRTATLFLGAVTAVIGAVPAFLRGTRALEIAAVRWLLAVDLPDPLPTGEQRETRLRAALWFATHLAVGGVVALGLLIALPMALVFVAQHVGGIGEAMRGQRFGPFDEHDTGWLTLTGLAMLVAIGYLVSGLGALAATMAPVLLGPSSTERIAALEARATKLAERNRLARELHDSVGHALTVTTLQAAAAQQLLDTDPAFVRRALTAIEETGRSAMEELDEVLGVLRDGDAVSRTVAPTLAALDRLVTDARLEVDLRVEGDLEAVPPTVSREGYRIVQEALTNALRHAGAVPVTLRVSTADNALDVEVVNPVSTDHHNPDGRPGRGLRGMQERVTLLGGRLTVGPVRERWLVRAHLPYGGPT